MAEPVIRLAGQADIPAAAEVHIESCLDIYRPFVSEDYHRDGLPRNLRAIWAEERLTGGDFIMLAEVDGAAAGLVTVRAGEPAYIDHFHVRPTLKGKGIGRMLMRAVVEELCARGARGAYLDVAKGNDAALAFYEALGGQRGEEVMGDLFGLPLPAIMVRWADISSLEI